MNYLKYICLIAIFILSHYASAKPGKVTFIPEKLTALSSLTVHYTPGDETENASEINAFLYFWNRKKEPTLIELPLKKNSDDSWSADANVKLDTIVYISCKIVSDKFEDTNDDRWWSVRIYKNEKPLEGALLAEVQSIALRKNGFKAAGVPDEALKLLEEEHAMYPNSSIWSFRWQLLSIQGMSDNIEQTITHELDSLVASSKSESDLLDFSVWYDRLSKPQKAEAVLDTLISRYKNKSASVRKELRPLNALRDYDLVKTALKNIIQEYPETQEADGLKSSLVQIAMQQKNFEEAAGYIKKYNIQNSDMCVQIARVILNENKNPTLANELAERGLELAKKSSKPSHLSRKEWEPTSQTLVTNALSVYGSALTINDRCADAEKVFEEALQKNPKGDPDLYQNYIQCLKKNKKSKEALAMYDRFFSKFPPADGMVEEYRKLYEEVNGSTKGLDEKLKQLTETASEEKFTDLKKSILNKSIKDFTLSSLTGESVTLEKLKGKVVVLDFWATWCGPCKVSFPHLQKVYEKYKSKSDVLIYAVNTYERVTGDSRKQSVEKFIKDNKYTFPVLMDTDVASTNGIQSIPTQFVIDKQGLIQFMNVGFEGPQMVDELSAKIELLRSEEFYK